MLQKVERLVSQVMVFLMACFLLPSLLGVVHINRRRSMADFVRVILGFLFAFNVIALVILTVARFVEQVLKSGGILVVIAVNIFVDALMFYVLF